MYMKVYRWEDSVSREDAFAFSILSLFWKQENDIESQVVSIQSSFPFLLWNSTLQNEIPYPYSSCKPALMA